MSIKVERDRIPESFVEVSIDQEAPPGIWKLVRVKNDNREERALIGREFKALKPREGLSLQWILQNPRPDEETLYSFWFGATFEQVSDD